MGNNYPNSKEWVGLSSFFVTVYHPTETIPYQDDRQIVELLVSQPSPEAILAIRPTPELQARMSELLARNKSGILSRSEEVELDRYLLLEHWVRLAKADAYKRLQTIP